MSIRYRVSSKLILTVGVVAIAGILVFAFITTASQQKALLTQIDHNANQLSETVKSSTRYEMMLNQRDHIHRIIDTIGRQEGIEKIRIFNKEGRINYSSDKDEIGQMVDKAAESCYACHTSDQPLTSLSMNERTRTFATAAGHRDFGIINPINNEPGCWQAPCHAHKASQRVLGVLDVTLSLAEVEQQIASNKAEMVIFAITAILSISLLLAYLVQTLVGKPVKQLVDATNRVAAGNLSYKIPVKRRDEIGQLAAAFNDMTGKLSEAQRQVYQSDKLSSIGRLAAGVAHEINNPLTGVLSYSSFLLKRNTNNPEVTADLEVIVRETKRCREIVKGLLDFARPVSPEKASIDLNEALRRTVGIVASQFQARDIVVQVDFEQGLPPIYADTNQIQQVMINLLVNAADAIGKSGGSIKIATRTEDVGEKQYVITQVSDNGCGIKKEELSKIFEPFYTTKGQKGNGLGLSVVWGIVEKHGGKIDVTSEVGEGTLFTLRLPVATGAVLSDASSCASQQGAGKPVAETGT